MAYHLTREQQDWLEAEVAAGRFPSVDDGVEAAIERLIADETDDLAWARSHVEAARRDVARGAVADLATVAARLRRRFWDRPAA